MNKSLPILNLITYLVLIVVNFLAVKIPFFGKTPGDVSDIFSNPFTPADFAFKIWWVIYVLLGVFIFFQSKNIFQKEKIIPEEVLVIGYLFMGTCLFNFLWLLTWQSMHIVWAFLMIFILWILLIVVVYRLTMYRKTHWAFSIPFSVYLSWVSVATLANLNVVLIDMGFEFFGLTPESWSTALVVLGILGGLLVFFLYADYWFLLVLAWAYFGVYQKNMGTDHLLPNVTLGAMFIILILAILAWTIRKKENKTKLKS